VNRGRGSQSPAGEGLFHASVSLGRVAGVEIGVNWSWLLIVGLMVASLAATVFPEQNAGLSGATYVAMAVAAVLLFFASLLAHELGHALQARREGVAIEGITLWVFGGVARFGGMFPSAGAELRIALAGPLVTLVLAAAFLACAAALSLPAPIDGVISWLGTVNVVLLAFNMLPALPLDGGRVLRAVLWQRSGDFSRATRAAGALGRFLGQALVGGGVFLFIVGAPGGLWLALIGWFISGAAAAEAQLAELRSVLGDDTVGDVMVRDPVTAPADATLASFMDQVFARSRHAAYPVTRDGDVVGAITFRAVAAVAAEDWPRRRVRETMIPLAQTLVLDPEAPLFPAVVELIRRPPNRALVTAGGRLVGLLSITDVSRLLELRRRSTAPSRPLTTA
jgi:Zn-dependent protease